MSDPNDIPGPGDIPGRHVPPRAEPLQPDRPGQGDDSVAPQRTAEPAEREGAEEDLRKQSEAALRNVRKGYD